MINANLPPEIFADNRLGIADIRVLGILSCHRGADGRSCHPSRERIAELTGLDKQRISRITTKLEKLNYLSKTGKGGYSKSCRYILNIKTVSEFDTVSNNTPETVSEFDTVDAQNGVKIVHRLAKQRCQNLTPDPVSEFDTRKEDNNLKREEGGEDISEGQANRPAPIQTYLPAKQEPPAQPVTKFLSDSDFTPEMRQAQQWAVFHSYWQSKDTANDEQFFYLWHLKRPNGLQAQWREHLSKQQEAPNESRRRPSTAMDKITDVFDELKRETYGSASRAVVFN